MDSQAAEEASFGEPCRRSRTPPHCDDALATIEPVAKTSRKFATLDLLERGQAFRLAVVRIARTLVRLAAEKPRSLTPSGCANIATRRCDSLEQGSFPTAPIYADLETALWPIRSSLLREANWARTIRWSKFSPASRPRSGRDELVARHQAGRSRRAKQLAEGGAGAIDGVDDPMIQLARLVDRPARAARKPLRTAGRRAGAAGLRRVAPSSASRCSAWQYPDATFTLRLSFGWSRATVERRAMPAWTTIGGLYARARNTAIVAPFALPQRWIDARSSSTSNMPMNFVFTADIIGGNSGTPAINRAASWSASCFDGDLHSLVWDYVYTPDAGRATAVYAGPLSRPASL